MLNESSGLTFLDGKLWSFSDSGNPNDIYRIDTVTNTIFQTVDVSNATNVDWEDMASNNDYLFVGDFGNNNGNRQDLKIYRINKSALTPTTTSVTASIINFSFSDQTSFVSNPTNHNFDCEAMIFLNDSIHLFSKNWVDFQTKHYILPNSPGTHVAQLRETLNTGFLVTGATVQQFGVISLIGYLRTGTKPVSLYMLYDYKNNLFFNGNKRKFDLSTQNIYGQVEGVEFFNNSLAFVSNELYTTGANVPAKLRSFNLASYLPGAYLFPKPIANFIVSNATICENAMVIFTDQSVNLPTSWQWSFPGGIPSSSTLQNPQVQYPSAGVYNVSLVASNAAGNDTLIITNFIAVNGSPVSPTSITGSNITCVNTQNNLYSVDPVVDAISYTWIVPAGAIISSGQGTNIISVEFSNSAISGDICVLASNSCGSSADHCLAITVFNSIPAKPLSIAGNTLPCAGGTGMVYSCPVVANATSYQWTVPSTATIMSGQGTNTISVNFLSNFTSGSIKVAAVNCVGSSLFKSLSVRGKPSTPALISGLSEEVCAGSTNVAYSIAPVVGATSYNWTLPANTTLVSGQGTTSITLNFDALFKTGALKVSASNACGTSGLKSLTIRSTPKMPDIISGAASVCANQVGVAYSIPNVLGASSYTWKAPTGAVITGQTTPSVLVDYGVVGGSVKVKSNNTCGSSAFRTMTVTMTCRDFLAQQKNEWDVTVYPNPSSSNFTLDVKSVNNLDVVLLIRDFTGREVQRVEKVNSMGPFQFGSDLLLGIYLVEISDGFQWKTIKLIKQL
ncbi:MAG: T9SS type A sorting domain-containing protein [Bacteroidetes bacterium]|nr:T9SS type A sorting domain-containing protein [Bacteroidota bacterium]